MQGCAKCGMEAEEKKLITASALHDSIQRTVRSDYCCRQQDCFGCVVVHLACRTTPHECKHTTGSEVPVV